MSQILAIFFLLASFAGPPIIAIKCHMMTNLEDENGLKEKINPEHLKEMKKRQEEGCPKELPSVIGEQNRTAIIDSCLLWTCEGKRGKMSMQYCTFSGTCDFVEGMIKMQESLVNSAEKEKKFPWAPEECHCKECKEDMCNVPKPPTAGLPAPTIKGNNGQVKPKPPSPNGNPGEEPGTENENQGPEIEPEDGDPTINEPGANTDPEKPGENNVVESDTTPTGEPDPGKGTDNGCQRGVENITGLLLLLVVMTVFGVFGSHEMGHICC